LRAIIADTGLLCAEADRSDQYHQRSRSELLMINREKLTVIVPYPIYLEAHKLVLYASGVQAGIAFAERLALQTNLISPTPEDYQTALRLMSRFTDQQITLFDAFTAVLALQMQLSVWTYDFHFEVMGVPVWR
jgi:predicted nucleic acid-binding protein